MPNLVKAQINVKIYEYPLADLGNGPIRSMWARTIGALACGWFKIGAVASRRGFSFRHVKQFFKNLFTSLEIDSQYATFFIRSTVAKCPACPARGVEWFMVMTLFMWSSGMTTWTLRLPYLSLALWYNNASCRTS